MTVEQIADLYESRNDEYLKFDRVPDSRRLHRRPDMNAFLLLDRLCPDQRNRDMVSAAEHDEYWLEVTPEDIAPHATEDDILDLMRCGIRYDDENDAFAVFA